MAILLLKGRVQAHERRLKNGAIVHVNEYATRRFAHAPRKDTRTLLLFDDLPKPARRKKPKPDARAVATGSQQDAPRSVTGDLFAGWMEDDTGRLRPPPPPLSPFADRSTPEQRRQFILDKIKARGFFRKDMYLKEGQKLVDDGVLRSAWRRVGGRFVSVWVAAEQKTDAAPDQPNKLARARKDAVHSDVEPRPVTRVYLDVAGISDADSMHRMGAAWDKERGLWYVSTKSKPLHHGLTDDAERPLAIFATQQYVESKQKKEDAPLAQAKRDALNAVERHIEQAKASNNYSPDSLKTLYRLRALMRATNAVPVDGQPADPAAAFAYKIAQPTAPSFPSVPLYRDPSAVMSAYNRLGLAKWPMPVAVPPSITASESSQNAIKLYIPGDKTAHARRLGAVPFRGQMFWPTEKGAIPSELADYQLPHNERVAKEQKADPSVDPDLTEERQRYFGQLQAYRADPAMSTARYGIDYMSNLLGIVNDASLIGKKDRYGSAYRFASKQQELQHKLYLLAEDTDSLDGYRTALDSIKTALRQKQAEAEALARARQRAADREERMKKPRSLASTPFLAEDHIYLNVPFGDKDKAKALGAEWDNGLRLWYWNVTKKGNVPSKLTKFVPAGAVAEQPVGAAPTKRILLPGDISPPLGVPVMTSMGPIVFLERHGSQWIDNDTPSMQGSHLLGHEGSRGYVYRYRMANAEEAMRITERVAV